MKLKAKLMAQQGNGTKLVGKLREAVQEVSSEATKAVVAAVAAQIQSKGKGSSLAALFDKLRGASEVVPTRAMEIFLREALKASGLTKGQRTLFLSGFPEGISRLAFGTLFQDYRKVVKAIAMTSELDMKGGKSLRRLDVDEVMEVLQGGKKEDVTGLERARVRALQDGLEGWATIRGSQGTTFLAEVKKPYLVIGKLAPLEKEAESGSEEVRSLRRCEVLEVLEGPRTMTPEETLRARVLAVRDCKLGWLTFSGPAGATVETSEPSYLVRSAIALTDALNTSTAKSIRRLDSGEVLHELEAPATDPKTNLQRIKVAVEKDGTTMEGWATLRGNQGTVYVAVNHEPRYTCLQKTSLTSAFSRKSKVIRDVEVGEIVVVMDNPRPVKTPEVKRVNVRALNDGAQGWISMHEAWAKPWASRLKCLAATPLVDTNETDGTPQRTLAAGEIVDALEAPAPSPEPAAESFRVRVRAHKDGTVGFVTTWSKEGKPMLEPLLG